MNKISSIIPLKTYDFSFYRERLALRAKMSLSNIETVLIDDGSPEEISKEIKEFCESVNFVYKRLNTSKLPFSLSRARNAGIDAASNEWIVMEDADIIYEVDFYNKLSQEVDLIDETPFNFLTIPVIYLKEEISQEIILHGSIDRFIPKILSRLQFENPLGDESNCVVESYAPATALFVVRKKLLNIVGGYDEYFVGWGGEDRDIAFRLLSINSKVDNLPVFFDATKSWSLNKTYDYEGWRSFYRLTGDYLANKGLYGYHIYHPKLEWREKTDTKKNIEFAKEKAISFYKNKKINPRFNKNDAVNIIIGYNPYLINDYILSSIDNVCVLDDDRHSSYHQTLQKIRGIESVEKIYFWNPYGNEWKLNLYFELKKLGYKVVVAERGALPDSYYFDEGGFCIESDSYASYELVVKNNSEHYANSAADVAEYIDNLRYGSNSLEKQNDRVPVGFLRLKLGIDSSKKILFCPLQLSTDTVTNYYVEIGRSYSDYIEEVRRLENLLPDDWVLVVKNHPLAIEKFSSDKTIIADNYHINDLLEAASSVILYNSGCGVLSMAFEKKVFYYGKCFYAIAGVNEKFDSAESVFEKIISNDLEVDLEKINQFFYFLIYHFYSFADVKNTIISHNGVNKNILKGIFYRYLKLPGKDKILFQKPAGLSAESILLGRYGKSIYLAKNSGVASKTNAVHPQKVNPPKVVSPEMVHTSSDVVQEVVKKSSSGKEVGLRLRMYKAIASPFLNKKKKYKLDVDPEAFFRDSTSKINKIVGKSLL